MSQLSDRLGEIDDKTVIYRRNGPEQRIHWGRWAGASAAAWALAAVLGPLAQTLLGDRVGLLVLLGIVLAFLVAGVICRRRRNKRLTGSPTTWPS